MCSSINTDPEEVMPCFRLSEELNKRAAELLLQGVGWNLGMQTEEAC
jgi:hypothetical protein